MDTPEKDLPAELDQSLETIELELAFESLEPGAGRFEDRVHSALDSVGGALLFYMPEVREPGMRKLAAVSISKDGARRVMLVLQEEDGETVRVESCSSRGCPISAVAMSFAQLSDRL